MQRPSMLPEFPSMLAAVEAVTEYMQAHQDALTQNELSILHEVHRRLERLAIQAAELVRINNQVIANRGLAIQFDDTTDTVIFRIGETEHRLTLKRADPNVPIRVQQTAVVTAFGTETDGPADEQALRIELEGKLESFYQSAHRILKLFGRVRGLKHIRCTPITRVRNELIEHPTDGSLYSFGTSSSGPLVKPRKPLSIKYTDQGLVPNVAAFVKAIVDGLQTRAP